MAEFISNINTDIKYDGHRRDITFCTMLFKIPQSGDLNALKHMDRKFEEFYLPSLRQLIKTFKKVCLWCDPETAQYLKQNDLDKNLVMRVMEFSELPHYKERDEWLKILHSMKRNRGYLLHHKTPEQWVDYMIIIAAKPSVIDFAASHNKFKSKYFMWVDGGGFNPMYRGFWTNWNGAIKAHPERCRFTIAPTLGKTRPAFVPKFIYNLYKLFTPKIKDATTDAMVRQDIKSIAMINADYDVPATSFMIPLNWAHSFYTQFETVRKIMKKHGLVSTEQAVFQTMMKLDTVGMFEVCYIRGYTGVYAAIAGGGHDCDL